MHNTCVRNCDFDAIVFYANSCFLRSYNFRTRISNAVHVILEVLFSVRFMLSSAVRYQWKINVMRGPWILHYLDLESNVYALDVYITNEIQWCVSARKIECVYYSYCNTLSAGRRLPRVLLLWLFSRSISF